MLGKAFVRLVTRVEGDQVTFIDDDKGKGPWFDWVDETGTVIKSIDVWLMIKPGAPDWKGEYNT